MKTSQSYHGFPEPKLQTKEAISLLQKQQQKNWMTTWNIFSLVGWDVPIISRGNING